MAIQLRSDNTEKDFWRGVKPLIMSDRAKAQSREAVYKPHRYKTPRNSKYKHSFLFNSRKIGDHRQLNIMDWVKLHHDLYHDMDWAPAYPGAKNQFMLNPDSNYDGDLSSVEVTVTPYYKPGTYDPSKNKGVVDENAVYKGRRLSNAIFYRFSNHDGGEDYAHNGLDPFSNFLLMVHNNGKPDKEQIPANRSKGTINFVDNLKAKFSHTFYDFYHTHRSWFTPNGVTFDNSQYRDVNSHREKPKTASQGTRDFDNRDSKGRIFNDSRKAFADDFTKSKYRFLHSVAYDYLCKVRGIAPAKVWQWGREGRIRSYQGTSKYTAEKPHSASDLKRLKSEGGRYSEKLNKVFFEVDHFPPMVEFPWLADERKLHRVDPRTTARILADDPKLFHHPDYGFVNVKQNKDDKKGKKVLRKSVKTGRKIVVGADRIFLHEDPSSRKYYMYSHPSSKGVVMSSYCGTNGKVDTSYHQRGKEIAPGSRYGWGWSVTEGTGKDTLILTEAPIDAGSIDNLLTTLKYRNATIMSQGGVSKTYTIDKFLQYQHAHPGEYSHIFLCYDNDPGGHRGVEKVMSSEHNMIDFAQNKHNISINPVTHSKQSVEVLVPGVTVNKAHQIKKRLPGDIGRFHLKDANDVLQAVRGLGRYKGLKGTKAVKELQRYPFQRMNGSFYTKGIVDDTLESANRGSFTGRDNARHMRRIFKYYHAIGKNTDYDPNKLRFNNVYIQKMRHEYAQMDTYGQTVLSHLMNNQHGNSGEFVSGHDLDILARHHRDVPVSKNEAKDIANPSRTFEQNIKHHVDYTMDKLNDKGHTSQKLYDLTLRSTGRLMPVVQGKVKNSLKREALVYVNGRFYRHIMKPNKRNNFNMYRNDRRHFCQAKYSIKHCLSPQFRLHKDKSFNIAVKASHDYLKRHGIKPYSTKEVFADGDEGRTLYQTMSTMQGQYNYLRERAEHIQKTSGVASASSYTASMANTWSNDTFQGDSNGVITSAMFHSMHPNWFTKGINGSQVFVGFRSARYADSVSASRQASSRARSASLSYSAFASAHPKEASARESSLSARKSSASSVSASKEAQSDSVRQSMSAWESHMEDVEDERRYRAENPTSSMKADEAWQAKIQQTLLDPNAPLPTEDSMMSHSTNSNRADSTESESASVNANHSDEVSDNHSNDNDSEKSKDDPRNHSKLIARSFASNPDNKVYARNLHSDGHRSTDIKHHISSKSNSNKSGFNNLRGNAGKKYKEKEKHAQHGKGHSKGDPDWA